ncbi:MAG: hypothetical protein KC912_17555 [Proteobacteria bacterium]|nr:hypothetical protein [Pseudomonadota bacterium]
MALEAATSLDGPAASPERLVVVNRVLLFGAVPFVLLPTGFAHLSHAAGGWHPEAAWTVAMGWWAALALCVLGSGVVLAVSGRGAIARWATHLCLLGLLTTNLMTMLGAGSLTTWGVLYIVILLAGARVALDYRVSLVAGVYGVAGLVFCSVIEWWGWVPLAPFAPRPVVHYLYEDGGLATTTVAVAAVALALTFLVINYAMNQSLLLHRYITHTVLRRYLPPALVERAARGDLRLDEAPERRTVTVLFSDLVGFTSLTERLGADMVAEHLNAYLSAMANLAHAHGATVDKFIGDAVMVVYGAPEGMPPEEQARRTVRLALEMVELTETLPGVPLRLRVGVNTGEAVVGNFGSQHRSDYTVIGPAVNVAARLEASGRAGRVLIGARTAELLAGEYELESVGPLVLKGVLEPVEAFMVTGLGDGAAGGPGLPLHERPEPG